MKLLTERIARDGQALDRDILLVDSFLNHQVDMQLMRQIGDAFAAHFRALGVTRVLTIESSGIAPGALRSTAFTNRLSGYRPPALTKSTAMLAADCGAIPV